MTQVAFQTGTTQPVNPIVMNSVTTSSTNPDGVVHIDTTQAQAGETSTITVTATDPSTSTTQTQSFQVTVASNPNASTLPLNLRPIAYSATHTDTVGTPQTIQLGGDPANSGTSSNQSLTYAITTPPTQGTISNFNPSTGTLTYTSNPNAQGSDSFKFTVTNSGAQLTSDPTTVTIDLIPAAAPDLRHPGRTNDHLRDHVDDPLRAPRRGGRPIPSGIVTVTLNGVTEPAAIDQSSGNFSTAFPTANLGVPGSPYTITYAYGGGVGFSPAAMTATINVTPAPLTVTADDASKVAGQANPAFTSPLFRF